MFSCASAGRDWQWLHSAVTPWKRRWRRPDMLPYSHLPNCSGAVEPPVNVLDVQFNQLLNWMRVSLTLMASPRWWESRSILLSWAPRDAVCTFLKCLWWGTDVDSAPAHVALIDTFIVLQPYPELLRRDNQIRAQLWHKMYHLACSQLWGKYVAFNSMAGLYIFRLYRVPPSLLLSMDHVSTSCFANWKKELLASVGKKHQRNVCCPDRCQEKLSSESW